jgi:hypothetical protein
MTLTVVFNVTMQVGATPVQAPAHPWKTPPAAAVALRVTAVPDASVALQLVLP